LEEYYHIGNIFFIPFYEMEGILAMSDPGTAIENSPSLWYYCLLFGKIMERTLVFLKPGVLQRRIAGTILDRFERKGFRVLALKLFRMDRALAEAHYAEHRGRDFYEKLVEYTLSGPVIAMVLEGPEVIALVRRMTGPTDIGESLPGTIRGDFACSTRLNIVHASDSPESAVREIPLFFKDEEICQWEDGNARWY
jgi:nucleoside-diphosphate kinase